VRSYFQSGILVRENSDAIFPQKITEETGRGRLLPLTPFTPGKCFWVFTAGREERYASERRRANANAFAPFCKIGLGNFA
jgi:hypothetical protein